MPRKIDNRHKIIGGRHRALSRYYMICNRVKNTDRMKNATYEGVKVLICAEDFVSWFMKLDFPGCSVDRINKFGNYEISNMQVIPLAENNAKDKLIARNGMCRCYECYKLKPISEFCKDSRRVTTGRSTICKRCESERTIKRKIRKANVCVDSLSQHTGAA